MWGFVVDCLKGVSQGACWSSQVCVSMSSPRKGDTGTGAYGAVCVCQAQGPCCQMWWVLVLTVGWRGCGLGQVSEGYLKRLPSFLPFFPLLTSHNLGTLSGRL